MYIPNKYLKRTKITTNNGVGNLPERSGGFRDPYPHATALPRVNGITANQPENYNTISQCR